MSVLNTMLQDLERRGALPGAASTTGEAPARSAASFYEPAAGTRRGSGRQRPVVLSIALLALLAGAGWYLLHGRSSAAVALHAGAQVAAPVAAAPAPVPTVPLAPPMPSVADPAARPTVAGTAPLPAAKPAAAPVAVAVAAPAASPAATHTTPNRHRAAAAAPAPVPAPAAPAPVAISSPQADLARASDLIARGQATEAESILSSVLERKPAMHDARFALAALLAERGARRPALELLLKGVDLDAARFGPTAAQLQAELGDPDAALATLDRVDPVARNAAWHALAAAIAQRGGHHGRAIEEYQANLQAEPASALSWVGLGVSLQAAGRAADAAAAFRNALQGSLSPQVRRFAEQRLRESKAVAAR